MFATAANTLQATTSKTPSQQLPHLELRILTSCVGGIQPANIASDTTTSGLLNPGPSTSPSDFTCLLGGPLNDFLLYSGQEHSQWLIDIAHDICDPALKRGSLQVWDETGQLWRTVNPVDPLIASIYLYDVRVVVSLSKISRRQDRSRTSATGYPSTMANRVWQRDGQSCWVSGAPSRNKNSHVCPKRMGDHLLHIIYRDFVSTTPPPILSIYHEMCGITLSPILDALFGNYELGLRFVSPVEYVCHVFPPPDDLETWEYTIYGIFEAPANLPLLHGYAVGPPNPEHASNPPPGLIRWHYLQCVIRKFADSNYKALQNIYHCELPLPKVGDSDDEDEGTDGDYAWPSAILDYGRARQAAIEDNEERQRSIEGWISTVQ